MRTNSNQPVTSRDFKFEIATHGNSYGLQDKKGNFVSASEFAEGLKPQIPETTKLIDLHSCHSANKPFANAQVVANVTGHEVFGYHGTTTADRGPDGREKFTPQTGVSAAITNKMSDVKFYIKRGLSS